MLQNEISKMVTLSVYLTLFLFTPNFSFGFRDYEKFFNFGGVFNECGANSSTGHNCACMNTVQAEHLAKDQRRQIASRSCHSCRSSCSTASCKELPHCGSECYRLCLCVCPNVTTNGDRTYIPCAKWCSAKLDCAAAVCKPPTIRFKVSSTGVIVGVTVLAVCFACRLFQKLRRKRFFLRQPSQQTVAVAEAEAENSRTSDEIIQLPPRPAHTLPMPTTRTAPPYSVVMPPASAQSEGGDMTSNQVPGSESDPPPDYETAISNFGAYRSAPPKYS